MIETFKHHVLVSLSGAQPAFGQKAVEQNNGQKIAPRPNMGGFTVTRLRFPCVMNKLGVLSFFVTRMKITSMIYCNTAVIVRCFSTSEHSWWAVETKTQKKKTTNTKPLFIMYCCSHCSMQSICSWVTKHNESLAWLDFFFLYLLYSCLTIPILEMSPV